MANWVQDMSYSNRSESLSDCIALESPRPLVSRYSNLRTNSRVQPAKMAKLETNASRREDRSTSTRIGGNGGLGEWPMPRSKRSREDIKAVGSVAADPRCHFRSATVPGCTQRHMLPGANLALKEVGTLNKRKGSLSNLGLGPMTTVQEGCLDSPTIPGHHPLFIRSMSYPDCTPRLSEEICETTPRESEFPHANAKNPAVEESAVESSDETIRRRSSTILRNELAPLIIPSSTRPKQVIQVNRPMPSDEQEDKPPQVPLKSPRTKSRASPRPRKLPHSANGSTSTISSTASAATSSSSLVGSVSSYSTAASTRVKGHFGHKGSLDSIKDSVRAGHLDRIGRHTPPRAESPRSRLRNVKNEEQETSSLPLSGRKRIESSPSSQKGEDLVQDGGAVKHEVDINSMWHQKGTSQASVIDRGRPMGRGDTSLMQKLSKPLLRTPSVDGTEVEIPSGLRAKEASRNLPKDELKLLKRQADERVESFEVLSIKDVSSLSRELALLDERCEYLRNTYNSLRQGRKGLHTRMISYLKSPRMAKFSGDSILKQEEALAELDLSIDDWVVKLEHADNRRTRVRQKLLEHVAATLTVKTSGSAQPQHVHEVQTPPRSPEKTEDDYKKEHRDVQSSEFYADSGVAALLSAIEMEIGVMDGLSRAS